MTETLPTTTRTESHVFTFPKLIDAGTYRARFEGAHEVQYIDKSTGEPAELLVWTFEIPELSEPDVPALVEGVSSLLLSARSKGFAWLRAIAPDIVNARTEIDAAELVGRPCMILVESTSEGDVKVADVLPPISGDGAKRVGKGASEALEIPF